MTDHPSPPSEPESVSYEIPTGEYAEHLEPGEVALWVPSYDGPPPRHLTSSTFNGMTQPFGFATSGTPAEWDALAKSAAMWGIVHV